MGLFRAAQGWRGMAHSLKSITYTTKMKVGSLYFILYLKKTQKIYESRDLPLDFCWHQHFFIGNQKILLWIRLHFTNISTPFWYIISNYLTFLESLKIILINKVTIMVVSAKLTTSGFLKIKIFQNKRNSWHHSSWLWRHQQSFIT